MFIVSFGWLKCSDIPPQFACVVSDRSCNLLAAMSCALLLILSFYISGMMLFLSNLILFLLMTSFKPAASLL